MMCAGPVWVYEPDLLSGSLVSNLFTRFLKSSLGGLNEGTKINDTELHIKKKGKQTLLYPNMQKDQHSLRHRVNSTVKHTTKIFTPNIISASEHLSM